MSDTENTETPPVKRRTRKAPEAKGIAPVQFEAPEEPETPEPVEAPEPETDDTPVLASSGLVAYNEYARNSRSVKIVQDALVERGHWDVRADPAGYWGDFTQAAALAETDETSPVEAARAMGFTVI